jgi:hypothetical protein
MLLSLYYQSLILVLTNPHLEPHYWTLKRRPTATNNKDNLNMPITISKIVDGFLPHPTIPSIVGMPTYGALKPLQLTLTLNANANANANAASV